MRCFASSAARRRAGAVCALVGLLAVAACGAGRGVADDGGRAASAASDGFVPATGGSMSIYTWYDFLPTALLERFEAETGISATIDYYEGNRALANRLEVNGGLGYDIVVPTNFTVKEMIDAGQLTRIDALDLPNGRFIAEAAREVDFDPGRVYSAPYVRGVTGFAYDASVLPPGQDPPASWLDFFTLGPPFAGNIGIVNEDADAVTAALLAVGGEPCTDDAAALAEAEDLLERFKPQVGAVLSDGVGERLGAGRYSASMIWNGDAYRARRENPAVTFVYPAEGAFLGEDTWVIPAGAANVPQALTFINWMLDPRNAAEAANYVGFLPPLDGIETYLSEDMLTDPALHAPAEANVAFVPPCEPDVAARYARIWDNFTH